MGLAGVVVLSAGIWRLVLSQERAGTARTISRLIEESASHEASGELGAALLALDSAISISGEQPAKERGELAALRERRSVLARRDATGLLDRLRTAPAAALQVGEWLNLRARIASDRDLSSLRAPFEDAFQATLRKRIDGELEAAQRAAGSGNPVLAFDTGESTGAWLSHLPPDVKAQYQARAERLLGGLIRLHGIRVGPLRGELLAGSLAKYQAETLPEINKALRSRGYLPQHGSPHWTLPWAEAPYHLDIELRESREGNYLSSKNRLTRINAQVRLYFRGRETWHTSPTSRTTVPLPNLPAYYSSRIALSPDRIDEFESLLYEDARGMIGGRLLFAIQSMPECEKSASAASPASGT